MEIIKIEVEVEKETYEAVHGLAKFGLVVREQLKDGWQVGEDLPPIVASAMADLLPGLIGIDKIPGGFKADASASVNAVLQGMKPFVDSFMAEKEA